MFYKNEEEKAEKESQYKTFFVKKRPRSLKTKKAGVVISISKTVLKRAVDRNLVRRRIKKILQNLGEKKHFEQEQVVFVTDRRILEIPFRELEEQLAGKILAS